MDEPWQLALARFLVKNLWAQSITNAETPIVAPTSRTLSLDIASKTDPGVLRSVNEDSIGSVDSLGLLVLADGMGGYQSGEVASRLTTQVVIEGLSDALGKMAPHDNDVATVLRNVVKRANRAIFMEGERRTLHARDSQWQVMGSTLALLVLRNGQVTVAHVGDSRIYRLRGGTLELMTHDHSLLQEQIDGGVLSAEAAATSHNRHLVTRGLGLQADVDISTDGWAAEPGDIYLLCSDGLNDMVDNADIELVLNSLSANLPLAASQLVMIANDHGGEDNISVIVAKVVAGRYSTGRSRGLLARLWRRLFHG